MKNLARTPSVLRRHLWLRTQARRGQGVHGGKEFARRNGTGGLQEQHDSTEDKERARAGGRLQGEGSLGRLDIDPGNAGQEGKQRRCQGRKGAGSRKNLPVFPIAEQGDIDTGATGVSAEKDGEAVLIGTPGDSSSKGSAEALMDSFHRHVAIGLNTQDRSERLPWQKQTYREKDGKDVSEWHTVNHGESP
jgi:hypothetical protein